MKAGEREGGAVRNRQRKVQVARRLLESFLERLREELRLGEAEVGIALVSDAEMARMNETFRGKKGPTDVLSFPADEERRSKVKTKRRGAENAENFRFVEGSWARHLGDVAIAPETARRYAKRNGRTLEDELRVLALHGVLHLLGYDHERDGGEMNRLEQRLRRKLGLK